MSIALAAFRSALTDLYEKPYCTGAVNLTPKTSTLFYESADSVSGMVNFAHPTDAQLESLAKTCQPATFGLNQEDVLDETYCKAGKLEVEKFATNFSPLDLGIVDAIRDTLLRDKNAGRVIRTELYKLNVYGPGAFFKSHVDTPRSETMFGSLVVLLPTAHEGGTLIIRHRDQEFSFDSTKAVISQDSPHAAYVAFFSDVEHAVSPVTKGYRVTLTYNLYFAEEDTQTSVQPEPPAADADEIAKEALVRLLQDPSFLPKGGFLGFGLSHKYPITLSGDKFPSSMSKSTDLKPFLERLKATDATFKRACVAAALNPELKFAYQIEEAGEGIYCLVDKVVDFEEQPMAMQEGLASWIQDEANGVLVFEEGAEVDDGDLQFKKIVWAKPIAQSNEVNALYVAYGNEPVLNAVYGDICLIANILPAEQRVSH